MSKSYIISYDLIANKDYTKLIKHIQNQSVFPDSARLQESVWLVRSNSEKADDVFNDLKQFIDNDDRLFVAETSRNFSGQNFIDNKSTIEHILFVSHLFN